MIKELFDNEIKTASNQHHLYSKHILLVERRICLIINKTIGLQSTYLFNLFKYLFIFHINLSCYLFRDCQCSVRQPGNMFQITYGTKQSEPNSINTFAIASTRQTVQQTDYVQFQNYFTHIHCFRELDGYQPQAQVKPCISPFCIFHENKKKIKIFACF